MKHPLLLLLVAAALGALALASVPRGDVVNATCAITGRPVDGERAVEHDGRRIGVCCDKCREAVAGWSDAQKDAYLARLTGAKPAAAPVEEAPAFAEPDLLTTCPISGEALGDAPVEVELRAPEDAPSRTVRVCCRHCAEKAQADPAGTLAKVDALVADQQRPLYPLDTCVVIPGEALALDGEDGAPGEDIATEVVVGGRLFRVCCAGCVRQVREDPAKFAAKLDAAAMEAQRADYPLDHCVVMTDHVFAESEIPREFVVAGRLVRVCCKKCEAAVRKDPRKYVAAIDAAR